MKLIFSPFIAPSAVRNVMATPIDSTSVLLSWEEPDMPNGALSYIIRKNNIQYNNGVENDATSLTITGLGKFTC